MHSGLLRRRREIGMKAIGAVKQKEGIEKAEAVQTV